MQSAMRMTRPQPARQASVGYVMTWVAVAVGGLAYLTVAAARPDLLSTVLPIADPAQEQIVAGRTAADVSDEIATLRKWVHDLQHEVAATRSALNDQALIAQQLSQRVAIAEDRLTRAPREVATEAAQPKAPPQRVQVRQLTPPPKAEPPRAALPDLPPAPGQAEQNVAALPPMPGTSVRILNQQETSPVVTGSLPEPAASSSSAASAQPPVPPAAVIGPAKVVPATPKASAPRGIVIGSSDSLETLRSRWGELSARNSADLSGLSPRYKLAADGRQAPFSLLAGPFDSPAAAQRACASLRAKGVACQVGDYAGSSL
jgi:hypothetical protein